MALVLGTVHLTDRGLSNLLIKLLIKKENKLLTFYLVVRVIYKYAGNRLFYIQLSEQ